MVASKLAGARFISRGVASPLTAALADRSSWYGGPARVVRAAVPMESWRQARGLVSSANFFFLQFSVTFMEHY